MIRFFSRLGTLDEARPLSSHTHPTHTPLGPVSCLIQSAHDLLTFWILPPGGRPAVEIAHHSLRTLLKFRGPGFQAQLSPSAVQVHSMLAKFSFLFTSG